MQGIPGTARLKVSQIAPSCLGCDLDTATACDHCERLVCEKHEEPFGRLVYSDPTRDEGWEAPACGLCPDCAEDEAWERSRRGEPDPGPFCEVCWARGAVRVKEGIFCSRCAYEVHEGRCPDCGRSLGECRCDEEVG